MTVDPAAVEQIADWMQSAQQTVVLTGAGISTESGIPDFRSPGGVWSKFTPVYFDDFVNSADARYKYWRQKVTGRDDFADAKPNAGHIALAQWEQRGLLPGVITQNVDGLHQDAGSERVLELHGTARWAKCLDCDATFPVEPLIEQFVSEDRVPECEKCGGLVKHATISFGQSLPADVLMEASRWAGSADLMLAIGSSLVVTPAADLPYLTKRNGGRLVIINRGETPLDDAADLLVPASIGAVLTAVEEKLAA